MTLDVDTLVSARVAAELRHATATRILEAAKVELQLAADALKATGDEINTMLAAEIKRLVEEAA